MTTEQFHNALLKGRGQCVLAVREDPEKYREEVMWACRELVSFDTQCEGSKSWFIHELVSCYPDRTPFVRAACDALIGCPSDGSWHLSSLAELVELFLQDGSQAAWKALMKKYHQLYHQMLHAGPPEDCCYWAARDDYERLAVLFGWNRDYCLDIARDMGRLSLETQWLKDYDFYWFYDTKCRRYLRALTRAVETDPLLAEFFRVHEEAWQKFEAQLAQRRGKRKRFPPSRPDEAQDPFGAFCADYKPRDEAVMLDYLQNQIIDFECTTSWHGDQLSVLTMDKQKFPAPKAALQFIFENTYCSECRCDALRQLGRRRMLTRELLKECLFDSNDDIRAYARRCLNRRKIR